MAISFSLKSLIRGKSKLPPRMIIYGPDKIGKSTFGSQSPDPVFIPTEDGLDGIDVTRFPLCTSYEMFLEAMAALYTEKHDRKTLVVDSGDWLEALIHKRVATDEGKEHIDDIGYQKGYGVALDYWREVLEGLNALRLKKGMAIIILAHHEIKRFEPPDMEAYDRYQIKLHKNSAPLLREWADIIGFANYKVLTKVTGKDFNDKEQYRALSGDERILHLTDQPTHAAGNRFSLPASIPFSWADFSNALASK